MTPEVEVEAAAWNPAHEEDSMTLINKQLNIDCPSQFIVQGAPKVHDMAPCECRKMSPSHLGLYSSIQNMSFTTLDFFSAR